MKLGKFRFFGSGFLIFTLLLGALSLSPSSITPAYADQNKVDVLIGFEGPPNEALIKSKGGAVSHNFHPFINVLAVSIPEPAIQGILKNPNVLYVEEDAVVTAQGHTSTDPEYQNSWGVDHIEADLVAADGNSGTGVKVAVIDTGIDYTHSDLDGNYQVGGPDFVEGDGDPMDDNGHGTHVAGTVAAEKNGFGVVGTGPQISIYGVKVLDSGGGGSYSDLIAAIQWSASNVDIASMSLSGGSSSSSLASAVQKAHDDGLLMIAAAGNSGNPGGGGNNIGFPAQYDEVVAVVATNQNDIRASFSSTGPQAELAAPGVSVYSTYLGGYATLSGTSMSTPHVSGSAALVMNSDEKCWSSQVNGDGLWTNTEVRSVLQSTADDLGDPGRDTRYGFGLVDPDEAAQQCSIAGHTPPTANDDLAETPEDNPVDIDVLANDTDGDDTIDPSTVSVISAPSNGQASVDAVTGVITYTPNSDYNGNDSFTYTVKDNAGATSNEATVDVSISAVNDAPVASDDSASTTVDTAVTIDVLSNDTDVDGDSLSVSSVDTSTSSGTATINADNTITYTPASGFTGTDSFDYSITDGNEVDTATVTVTVSEPSAELTITGIEPNTASRGTVVSVMISGTGFVDDVGATTVQMEGGSGPAPDVVVTSVSTDGLQLSADVYIKSGGPPRDSTWDVRVTNPDGSSDVLSGGFTVTS